MGIGGQDFHELVTLMQAMKLSPYQQIFLIMIPKTRSEWHQHKRVMMAEFKSSGDGLVLAGLEWMEY